MTPSKPPTNAPEHELVAHIEQLEREIATIRTQLDSATRLGSLGLPAGAIAHEFNNLLTPVLSYARVALDNLDDTMLTQRALQRAVTGVEKATRIAGSVLRLAGSEMTTEHTTPSCCIDDALESALASLPRSLDAESIELKTDFDPRIILSIRQTDLEHVLLNLILNAVRAMKTARGANSSSGGVLTLSCHMANPNRSTWNTPTHPTHPATTPPISPSPLLPASSTEKMENSRGQPGFMAHIQVADTGIGIDWEIQKTLPIESKTGNMLPNSDRSGTAPAQHAHAGPHQHNTGNGLGLAIIERLIEAAKGSITFQSQPGAGTTFDILLPASHHAA